MKVGKERKVIKKLQTQKHMCAKAYTWITYFNLDYSPLHCCR